MECHYFASTAAEWIVENTLTACVKRIAERSKKTKMPILCVAKVPLPKSASYSIRMYMPVVEGVEVITEE